LMKRWGKWGRWYGSCDSEDCQYSISMNDPLFNAPQFVFVYENALHAGARVLDRVGLRTSQAFAGFHVVHGVVTNKRFGMSVALPFRDWGIPDGTYWPSLEVQFSEGATLRYDNPRFLASRPNHAFVQRRSLLEANFTQEESPEEMAALMDFHFDCITRWSPCLKRAELLPRADEEFETDVLEWRRKEKDGKATDDNNYFTPTCFPTLEIRAREERDVLVGDVVRARVVQAPWDSDPRATVWMIDVRLLQLLKGKAPGAVGSIISVYERGITVPAPGGGPWPFRRVVVTGMTSEGWGTHDLVVYSGDCGTVEASPENLAAARNGVEEDFGPRP
jgi:hypothetical protein